MITQSFEEHHNMELCVASNYPSWLVPLRDFSFCYLGDKINETNALVLMLQKNWGAGSIDKIKDILFWIKQYPKETRCLLAGCEMTVPDLDISKYIHSERDNAIRELCDEVLTRSKSIGVRGEITKKYLVDILGYDETTIRIISTHREVEHSELKAFIHENEPRLLGLMHKIAEFQLHPFIRYERPHSFRREIIISRPQVSVSERKARLSSIIIIDERPVDIWLEVDVCYKEFLLHERSDAFLSVLIPFAMRTGHDIVCEAPVSDQLLLNLSDTLIPHLVKYDQRMHRVTINASASSAELLKGHAVATGMSCGVDSMYSLYNYYQLRRDSLSLTHLYCGNYLYGNSGKTYDRAEAISRETSLPLIRTTTNINEELPMPHLQTHFFKMMFGILALRKFFKAYYYSSGEDFGCFSLGDNSLRDTAEYELLLLLAFNYPGMSLLSGGGALDRPDKTSLIADFSLAHNYLNVCLYPDKRINCGNCGNCGKCMRTLVTLDMTGAIDKFSNVFDVNEYKIKRKDAFAYLVQNRKSPLLKKVFDYFSEREPSLMQEALERTIKV